MNELLRDRILILDGAIGTVLGGYGLREEEVRGEEFADHNVRLKDNLVLLTLTRPDIVETVHRAYLNAGADILSTNSFTASALMQARYGLGGEVSRLNREAAELTRRVVDDFMAYEPDRTVFVLGCIGPSDIVPDTVDTSILPHWKRVPVGKFEEAVAEQATGLIRGGADILGLETVPCTQSAAALCRGVRAACQSSATEMPLWISVTVDREGSKLLSGEALDEFVAVVGEFSSVVYGVNCGFGHESVETAAEHLARLVDAPIAVYPSAGLPGEDGIYPDSPETLAEWARAIGEAGTANIIGGCCGTTPEHIRQMANAVEGLSPRTFS
jgi:5-methyltetrahydrofolate--homocysteine methyltransferase